MRHVGCVVLSLVCRWFVVAPSPPSTPFPILPPILPLPPRSTYMFETPLTISGKNGQETMKVCEMLAPIKSSKYPAITPEEEAISVPLQAVVAAVFDSVQVGRYPPTHATAIIWLNLHTVFDLHTLVTHAVFDSSTASYSPSISKQRAAAARTRLGRRRRRRERRPLAVVRRPSLIVASTQPRTLVFPQGHLATICGSAGWRGTGELVVMMMMVN